MLSFPHLLKDCVVLLWTSEMEGLAAAAAQAFNSLSKESASVLSVTSTHLDKVLPLA